MSDTGGFAFQTRLPLKHQGRVIRVLSLHPGSTESSIYLSAQLLRLADPARSAYTALSYTWGNTGKTRRVSVDTEVVPVTQNLYDALRHMRSAEEFITVWVDAVCIDQDDLQERSHQVALMDEVYRSCEKCVVWLGCSAEETEECNPFTLVEHFRDDKHFWELPGYQRDEGTKHWTRDTECAEFKTMWKSFDAVAHSPWWTRAWTAQETILPQHLMVLYGRWSVSWPEMVAFRMNRCRHLNDYSDECCGHAHEAVGWKQMHGLDTLGGNIMRLESLRKKGGYIRSFSDVSRVFADRQCKDARDKVYSILSFATSNPSLAKIEPDYGKSVCEVYTDAFTLMLKETGMSPFCLLGQGFHSSGLGLPSWVRDFSMVMNTGYLIRRAFEAHKLYDTCLGRTGKVELIGRKRLQLHGLQFDHIKAKSVFVCDEFKDEPHLLKNLLDDWRSICRENGIHVDTEVLDERFARVLCREVIDAREAGKGSWRRLHPTIDPALPTDSQWAEFMTTGNRRALPRMYRIGLGTATYGQILYVTEGGRIGLSYPSVEVGDTTWVVEGSNEPFVFRGTDTTMELRLLGDTYLYGVMSGEILDNRTALSRVVLV